MVEKILNFDRQDAESLTPAFAAHDRNYADRNYAEGDLIRLSTFFRLNPVPILVFCPDGEVIKINPAADRLLKQLQLSETALLPANHRQVVRSCLSKRRESAVEVAVGDRRFALTYHPLDSFRLVYLYAIDVTEFRRAESSLLRLMTHTRPLARMALLQLLSVRRSLPQAINWRRAIGIDLTERQPMADWFVAMDGCVFAATQGSDRR